MLLFIVADLILNMQRKEKLTVQGYTIGQIASYSGISVDTVRVYERQGLIKIPERRANGYRHYSKEYLKRINFIKWVKTLGFTLREIKELLDISRPSTHACKDIRDRLESKLDIIEKKRKELLCFERALELVIQTCDTTKGKECPILKAL